MPSRLRTSVYFRGEPSVAPTDRRASTALPIAQFFSGLRLESIDTCTMGISSKASPNMSLKGTNTPWSNPGPENPRPSWPRASGFEVVRAR